MIKKALFASIFLLLPFGASANCDLSVKNVRTMSESYLGDIYAKNPISFKKPKLIVSNKKVKGYYAEELKGVITIYPKSFKNKYCDQYFDSLSPFIAEVVAHEYTHFLDEKINLSKKLGEKEMSEKTAQIGEQVFANLSLRSDYSKKVLTKADQKKYNKFLHVLDIFST